MPTTWNPNPNPNTIMSTPAPQEGDLTMDRHVLQSAITSLHRTLEYISTLPIAVRTFTPVDRALLDAMGACVGTLGGRHFVEGDGGIVGKEEGGERKNGGSKLEEGGLEKLEKLVLELALSVQMLGSSWEIEGGGGEGICVLDLVDEEKRGEDVDGNGEEKENEKEEEGWVDVVKEDDGNDHSFQIPEELKKEEGAVGDTRKDEEDLEKDLLLPPLSAERKDELLDGIASTTTQILTLTQNLHSQSQSTSSPSTTLPNDFPIPTATQTITIKDHYNNSITLPLSHTLAQIRSSYPSTPDSLPYELLDAKNRTRPFVTEEDWLSRKQEDMTLIMAVILTGFRAVARGTCPLPGCNAGGDGEGVEICEYGGWVCKECDTWFDHDVGPLVPEVDTTSSSLRQTWNTPQSEANPFREFPSHYPPSVEDRNLFKFVKTYPLAALDFAGNGNGDIYKCQRCLTHLALKEDIISRNFRGLNGKAFLFDRLSNITKGRRSERMMTTGKHLVVDVHCRQCKEYVGWGYEQAGDASESYKIGKFILEMGCVVYVTRHAKTRDANESVVELQHRLLDLLMKEEKKAEESGSAEKGGMEVSEK